MTRIEDLTRIALVAYQVHKAALLDRLVDDESGEGVISAAIAVLVMAFLGAAMWIAFKTIFDGASGKVEANVNDIGT
jgi:hypothetical protein